MIHYILLIINVLCAIDIYRDSRKRKAGFLYPLLGLFFGIFGLVIYRFLLGGSVAFAINTDIEAPKIGPFYRFGTVFVIIGGIFFLLGFLMYLGEATGSATDLQAPFLLVAGVLTALFGSFFIRYDVSRRKALSSLTLLFSTDRPGPSFRVDFFCKNIQAAIDYKNDFIIFESSVGPFVQLAINGSNLLIDLPVQVIDSVRLQRLKGRYPKIFEVPGRSYQLSFDSKDVKRNVDESARAVEDIFLEVIGLGRDYSIIKIQTNSGFRDLK